MSVRVHELAKQMNMKSSELLKTLKEMGYEADNHFARIDEDTVEKLKKRMASDKATSPEPLHPEPPSESISSQEDELPGGSPESGKHPVLKVAEGITVKEYADLVGHPVSEIIKELMSLGELVTINQPISQEAITILSEHLGFEAEIVPFETEAAEEVEETDEIMEPRAPVVTVMGHVDHGKTSLLDAIRKTDVISTEAGGITQHIGAYQVNHNSKKITFIDTPGHEAFTAMRARGAKITDVAVLVVAADDGVMPQTIEAIDHAKAAGVPILVAVNKIDKPEANPDKVRKDLSEHGLVPEEWGGQTVFVNVSAKQKTNLDELLEMLLLVAEIQELKARRKGFAKGTVVEAKLDRGRGPVATVLVEKGTLKVGNAVVAGLAYGRIRAMIDDKGNNVQEAVPAQPVELLGLSTLPMAGDEFAVVEDEKKARRIAEEKSLKQRLVASVRPHHVTLDDLYERIKEGEIQDLNLIIKADTQGSIEALVESLEKIDQREVRINIIHSGVGAITETDIMLSAASDAIVIGFNVRPEPKAKTLAEKENVDVRMYRVIYQVVEDITAARLGMLTPEFEEVEIGRVEVRQVFRIPKIGFVAGCYVSQGEINRDSSVRVVRDGTVIHEGQIADLHRFKDDVKSVQEGFECGIALENFQDIKEGDILEIYTMVEKPPGGGA